MKMSARPVARPPLWTPLPCDASSSGQPPQRPPGLSLSAQTALHPALHRVDFASGVQLLSPLLLVQLVGMKLGHSGWWLRALLIRLAGRLQMSCLVS